jgi:glycosyltransferase involved in cell wall biosynthesis
MLAPIYALNLLSILYSVLRLRKRFDIFIGVGFYPTFFGLILRRLGVVNRLIYYSIDYFTRPLKFSFDTFYTTIFQLGDKMCAKASNIVWHASSRVAEARKYFAGLHPDNYQHIVVPVGFRSSLLRHVPFKDIERSTIVFVGTYGKFHGLDLLLDAMPLIIEQVPNVKVRIIGSGPWDELKRLVAKLGLRDHFIFHGFIKDEEKLFDLVSRCAIGIAPYTFTTDNPTLYSDPGKLKLYAFCGLPVIVTKTAPIASEIHARKAGIAINYDSHELASAVVRLLSDDQLLANYRHNANIFAQSYTSEHVFPKVFKATLQSFNKKCAYINT